MKWNVKAPRTSDNLFDDFIKSRNITDFARFTSDKISDLHNPYDIPHMGEAVEKILSYVSTKKKIYVYGDFDVDGTAATATLWGYLHELEANVWPFIPNRVDEGYGMSEKTLRHLKDDGAELVISVDCGIRDIELTEFAKGIGLDLIITDHHEFVKDEKGNPVLPKTIIVHSKHPDGDYDTILSGGATAWKLICAIEEKLTGEPYTERTLEYIQFAALTTITDVMPLVNENRTIVKIGIKKLRTTNSIGLRKMYELSNIDPRLLEVYHLGFVIGPRLNAPGRVENSAMDSLRLLCTNKESQAIELAQKLEDLNHKRQDWTVKYMELAKEQTIEQLKLKNKIILIKGEDWPEGIVGLVAGKIAEKFSRPTLVATENSHEKKITGSARSIIGLNIVDLISKAAEHLSRYGGHRAAAGFALKPENFEKFKASLLENANKEISDDQLEPLLNIDMEAKCSDLTLDFVNQIETLAPYGNGNLTPLFTLNNLKVIDVRKLGKNGEHLKLKVSGDSSKPFDAIAFNFYKAEVFTGDIIDLAFTPKKNEWNGNISVQLEFKDIRKAD